MEFILILSPRSAPPVFFLEGSTEIIAIFLSGFARKNLLTNSSVREDFPAPPVPGAKGEPWDARPATHAARKRNRRAASGARQYSR